MTDDLTDEEATLIARRFREDHRIRTFPYLGWSVVLSPMDLFESRVVARMAWGLWYGFSSDDLVELKARRIQPVEDEPLRTWWVWAVRTEKLTERGIRPLIERRTS